MLKGPGDVVEAVGGCDSGEHLRPAILILFIPLKPRFDSYIRCPAACLEC